MTAFASGSGQDVVDSPRREAAPPPPPPSHVDAGPFAHQLNPNPPFPSTAAPNPPRLLHRPSNDFRHASANGGMAGANGNGPMPVPGGSHARMGNGHANMRDMGFGGPRSPPNNKSSHSSPPAPGRMLTRQGTSHVPCKFYRQGACQAGKACPFLHSDEPLTERAPCKYFTKGNCKFGPKCALAHILPDGRIVNRHHVANGGPFGRVNIPHHGEPASGGSLLSIQAHMAPNYPFPPSDDFLAQPRTQYDMIPTIDTTFSSHPGSQYGSPPNDSGRLPMSPVQKGLTVMDVPLPASFDSQGISHMARYGPIAASVPSKFLANSPPSSYQADSPALRNLHNSAFGDDPRAKAANLGSSPPESVEQPLGRRIMHSELGASRKGMISASVGARPPLAGGDDWDDSELIGRFEEDLIPSSLNDLLTPQEKMRRFSRDHGDNDGNSLSHRASLSRLGASPTASDTKVGSPSAATSSPSRFQSLWGKSRTNTETSFESGSLPGVSAFGHVGSPLRNSSLHPGASPSLRAMGRTTPGDTSPFVSSPPRQASMSMISQQLQRTRLSSRASEEAVANLSGNSIHPGVSRMTSGTSIGNAGGRLGLDRAVSSSSIGRERIEEEQGLFSMEEEDELDRGKSKDGASTTSSTSNKRLSGLSWASVDKQSPSLRPIGGHRHGNASGHGRDPNPWGTNP